MAVPDLLPAMPFDQTHVLGIAPVVRKLQRESPVTRVRTPAGDEAWLVTRYEEVRRLLGDRSLGLSHPDPEHAPRVSDSVLFGAALGNFETEQADHAQMRTLLMPFFSPKRMLALKGRVEELVEDVLDQIAKAGPPADLHDVLSVPLPVLVICELLGVPAEDQGQFRAWSLAMADMTDRQRSNNAMADFFGYMTGLVARKRAQPGNDVISGLCEAEGRALDDGHIAYLGALLLFAGHETTAVRIDLGTLLLLTNPAERLSLLTTPGLLQSAVEEILRATGAGGGWVPRWARTDLVVGGVTIGAGECVLLHIAGANTDERVFADPDRFTIARAPNPHLAFGYGGRYCIGAPLARMELQAVFTRLFARLPTLHLAVPVERIQVRADLLTGGLISLPVRW